MGINYIYYILILLLIFLRIFNHSMYMYYTRREGVQGFSKYFILYLYTTREKSFSDVQQELEKIQFKKEG